MDSPSPLNPLTRTHALVLLVVLAISVGYMATHLKRGWVPHDEGALGGSAERALNGELPNRDFDDYTGGLSFVHALAFRVFGINSASMRIVLFLFFVPWVPAVFYVASRFCSAFSAGAVTLLAVAWSVPNYPGPMPSWYNLFFATFGVASLLRYLEAETLRWLVVAGVCGGLSILAKITGAYYVAGALLFLLFREQSITNEINHRLHVRARFYSAIVALALTIFLAVLFRMIHKVPGVSGLVFFALPAFGVVGLLLAREFIGIAGQDRGRFIALLRMCVPFGMGVSIPLLIFLIPYMLSGSVHELLSGLVATSTRAVRAAVFKPVTAANMIAIGPFILPAILGYDFRQAGRAICGGIFAVFAGAILILSARSSDIYGYGWYSLTMSIPLVVLGGVAILWVSGRQNKLSLALQQRIMLILCVTAICSIVQFPFAHAVYFCYVAPLLMLTATALFASATHPPRFILGVLIGFYLLFAVLRVTPGFINKMGLEYAPDAETERLTIARAGGLRVEWEEAQIYEKLIPLVQSHAAGKFIFAAPDCPEVYFLAGLKSPTRHFFDAAEDTNGHSERTLKAIERLNVNVIAINKHPQFSGPLSPGLQGALERGFPNTAEVGTFQVRWRE
jgi:hypothetical protein